MGRQADDRAWDIIMNADVKLARILACGLWDMLMARRVSYESDLTFVEWLEKQRDKYASANGKP